MRQTHTFTGRETYTHRARHKLCEQKKSLLRRQLKIPRNTRLKPYTTRMAKIQGLDEGKTYSNIYKDKRAHT